MHKIDLKKKIAFIYFVGGEKISTVGCFPF